MKGRVFPTSMVMVLRKAARASSAWFDGDIEVGNDTSRYREPFDMFAAIVEPCEIWFVLI